MKKIFTLLTMCIFLIGMTGIAMANPPSADTEFPVNEVEIIKKPLPTPTQTTTMSEEAPKKKKSRGGGSFVTLWVAKDTNSPCEIADVITIRGVIVLGQYGVPVNEDTMKKQLERPLLCRIHEGPIFIGWWSPRSMEIFLRVNG